MDKSYLTNMVVEMQFGARGVPYEILYKEKNNDCTQNADINIHRIYAYKDIVIAHSYLEDSPCDVTTYIHERGEKVSTDKGDELVWTEYDGEMIYDTHKEIFMRNDGESNFFIDAGQVKFLNAKTLNLDKYQMPLKMFYENDKGSKHLLTLLDDGTTIIFNSISDELELVGEKVNLSDKFDLNIEEDESIIDIISSLYEDMFIVETDKRVYVADRTLYGYKMRVHVPEENICAYKEEIVKLHEESFNYFINQLLYPNQEPIIE